MRTLESGKSLIFIFLFISVFSSAQDVNYPDSWNTAGYSLQRQSGTGVGIAFSIDKFTFTENVIDGTPMANISLPGSFLPNDEGAPDLPGLGRFIALPQGAKPVLHIRKMRTETFRNIEMAPAPRIPLDTERGPLQYRKDNRIYKVNAFYPAEPVKLSPVTSIRGIDAVMLGITPFQYNPVTKELVVIRDIEAEIVFEGGNGHFGDDRFRSRWWDPLVQDMFLNAASLPAIDYSERLKKWVETDAIGYEYLIVVPNGAEFIQWADSIKKFRQHQGILTGVKTLNEIGGSTTTILENYFNNAYNNWEIKPAAVLLLADYGTNASNSITSPIWNSYCVSDNIFADVTGNSMPDIVFARITANNATQLSTMVTKFLKYERTPPTNAYFYDHPITALGWQTERWFQICSEVVGGFLKNVLGKTPVRINEIYDGTPGTIWSTATNTTTVVNYFGPNGLNYIPASPSTLGGWSGGTATMINNAINSGAFMLQHRDHGYEEGWGEPAYSSTNINSLTNTNLTFVFSVNCLTGKYNHTSECFAEKFHRYTYNGQNSGALGLLAASEVSYSFVNDAFVWGLYDNMWPQFMPAYGMPVDERGLLPAFGNASGKYFLAQSSWPYNTGDKEVTYNLFHHHGDAFLTLYSQVPQHLNVSHSNVIFAGTTSFVVTANAGSFICLSVNDEIIAIGDGTGSPVSLALPQLNAPSSVLVTITKQNYYRYESVVQVLPPAGPYVVYDQYIINDGSKNNGNGLMDYGETIGLSLTLKNIGIQPAPDVTAMLSTADPYVTITDNSGIFGSIPSGGTSTVTDAFVFDVGNNIPNGHSATFKLDATSGTSTWTSYFSITGYAPDLVVQNYTINDAGGNNNGILDPGETVPMIVTVKNQGGAAAYNVNGLLTENDPYLSVNTTTSQLFGAISPNGSATAQFTVSASTTVPAGYVGQFTLNLTADYGISKQGTIQVNFTDYCYPTANCSYSDGFTGFSLAQISNMSSGCSSNGYGNFTSMTATLEPGQTYTVSWKTGYNNQYACLWIDLNSDKTFQDTERLITDFNLVTKNVVYTTTFTVPVNANPGNKRLRIRAKWQSSAADPCTNFNYGETEDYTANVLADPVSAGFSANQTSICEGGQVQFINETTGHPVSWSWQFPGGQPSTSTLQNPLITYPGAGMFSVTLTAYSNNSSSVLSRNDFIHVSGTPGIATIPSGVTDLCENGSNTSYSTSGVAGATSYQWLIVPSEAGTLTGTGTTATVNWNDTFSGIAQLSVRGVNSCGTGTYSPALSITVNPLPGIAGIITGDPEGCQGEESTFSTTAIPFAASYEWQLNPEDAGTVTSNGSDCTVAWSAVFSGVSALKVRGVNDCGAGEWSSAAEIFVTTCNPAVNLPPGWEFTTNILQHLIVIPADINPTFYGNSLTSGDCIGVFYTDDGIEKCGGAIAWNPSQSAVLTAFGDDFSTPEKDGFSEGETMIWKLYSWNMVEEYPAFPIYDLSLPDVDGTFVTNGISGLLSLKAYAVQTIDLTEGWKGFSMPYQPLYPGIEEIFGEITDQMVIMQNNDYLFWPGQQINTFPDWQQDFGVQIKLSADASLYVPGIPEGNSVVLEAGWNYLPVLCDYPVSTSALFNPIQNDIDIVKEIAGYKVYWPAISLYTLETVDPYKAYLIKAKQPVTIEFPSNAGPMYKVAHHHSQEPKKWDAVNETPVSHSVAIFVPYGDLLQEGDVIGGFTSGGLCAGSVQLTGGYNVLTLFGDDPTTSIVDGFLGGEQIIIKLFSHLSGKEESLRVNYNTEFPSGDGNFTANGISLIKNMSVTGDLTAEKGNIVTVYPNPTGGAICVSGLEKFENLALMNIHGNEVVSLRTDGKNSIVLNLNELPKGLYFIMLSGTDLIEIVKVIVE